MAMIVQHNMNAINAYNKLNANVAGLKKSSEKLASGYRINRAGDDAAGLAISEKMRSQIRGLNQAVRNSQDGINMIQTFEGAAQETHNILQRMKELAMESANGTYDNSVDRAAIQLEFEQLNDELNQIADTDFNGTIVLNGGVMADGLKQINGEFDYANKADQVSAANKELLAKLQEEAQGAINAATAKVAAAQKKLSKTPVDLSNNGAAREWNTVDNNSYGKEQAAVIFGNKTNADLNFDGSDGLKVGDKNLADLGATSVDITFVYDGDGGWKAQKATARGMDGSEYTVDDGLTDIDDLITVAEQTDATGDGGFSLIDENGNLIANAIFDATQAKKGDTITLTFTNEASKTYAPTNIGRDDNSLESEVENIDPSKAQPTIKLASGIKDTAMTEELKKAFQTLNESFFEVEYDGEEMTAKLVDENGIELSGFSITSAANADTDYTDYTITFEGKDGKTYTLATVTVANGEAKGTKANTDVEATGEIAKEGNGTLGGAKLNGDVTLTFDAEQDAWVNEATGETVDLSKFAYTLGTTGGTSDDGETLNADGTEVGISAGDLSDIKKADGARHGDKIVIKATTDSTGSQVGGSIEYINAERTTGKISFGIAVEAYDFAADGGLTVKAGKDKDIDSNAAVEAQQALDKALAELEKAKAAYPDKVPEGVTKPDAYDNSTAKMTYSEQIVLQTGARTKDAVNFTFSYNRDGTADMGDLLANLNISARAEGLNTENLSLATQDDANYAIDQIDKAINKTSMVRATFGAIQNRLEHKITNLTTTSENLQEAESAIRDTDMAQEMMNYTKFNILQQAAQSMLAQANQQPQSILQLLG